MKSIINILLKFFGQTLVNRNYYNVLHHQKDLLTHFSRSNSQILQDVFVLLQLNYLKNGFFVEFGSTDGINLSNTFLLEKNYGWKGILVEPCKKYHKQLNKNRKCIIDHRCVYSKSGVRILFNEVEIGEFSTIDSYSAEDNHSKIRKNGVKYEVETVSLLDLLDQHNSPKIIDYLSVDTEGSEYDILNSFDFSKYKFRIITVEHNYVTRKRDLVNKLLCKNGYSRVNVNLSMFDDWYLNMDLDN